MASWKNLHDDEQNSHLATSIVTTSKRESPPLVCAVPDCVLMRASEESRRSYGGRHHNWSIQAPPKKNSAISERIRKKSKN